MIGRSLLTLADVSASVLDLAVTTPARVGAAVVKRQHDEVHGVASAVVASTAEVVRMIRSPGFQGYSHKFFATQMASAANVKTKVAVSARRPMEELPNR